MSSLLVKVKTKLSIYSHQKTRGLLEGEYGSVFKGRSMDFDDLREYIPGDDIKDIDWKATARTGQTLIKRYVAIRKHNILLAVDTGKNMNATSESGDSKKDIAILVAGLIGYIAQKHGDLVGLTAGDSKNTHYLPLKESNQHLENILQFIDKEININSPQSDFITQLEYIAKNIRRRMIIILIADDITFNDRLQAVLRRLRAQHELLWISVGDINPNDKSWDKFEMKNIESNSSIPRFFRENKKISDEFDTTVTHNIEESRRQLERLQIMSERIGSEADVVNKLFKLLEKQRYAKR